MNQILPGYCPPQNKVATQSSVTGSNPALPPAFPDQTKIQPKPYLPHSIEGDQPCNWGRK